MAAKILAVYPSGKWRAQGGLRLASFERLSKGIRSGYEVPAQPTMGTPRLDRPPGAALSVFGAADWALMWHRHRPPADYPASR